ncbi:class I SAM-dependent methyltransferase [Ekhidna sp.]|uniref:class I SAM-dependent methyltransferase n=1 Tax=Ekhidna sp. TaxID=2608089 RepID=UPI003CCC3095
MYEKLEECPVCNHTQFNNHIICDDHSVSKESFALVKCMKCQLVFTNPRPKPEHLHKYYESNQYISHTDRANSLINLVYKIVRKYTLRKKLQLVAKYARDNKSLLDYGCGTGDFLRTCRDNNWQAYGYEPDTKARDIAMQKNDQAVVGSLSDLKPGVQIITCWHVLEHVSDLKNTVKTLKNKLNDGGYLILALPNHQSYDANYYQEFWAAYDVPRHLYHFDQHAIKSFASKHKLKLIDTVPMKFDSYYVSILSEKYKNKKGILNAFKIGYLSNQKAKKTNQYSSLIYILRK